MNGERNYVMADDHKETESGQAPKLRGNPEELIARVAAIVAKYEGLPRHTMQEMDREFYDDDGLCR